MTMYLNDKKHKINNRIYLSILLCLPIFFVLVFARYALEDTDSGFIVGAGWRILNGEMPYRDFYYVRPPISLYLSALWLWVIPDYAQVFSMRLINYYQLLLQVVLTTLMLSRFYDFKQLKLNVYLFSIFCFLCTSIGTFYFQWHTTDGIFLAVAGFFLISQRNKVRALNFFFAGVLFALSALCKQNFALIIVLGLAFSWMQYDWKRALQLAIGVFITLSAFYFFLEYNQLTDAFVKLNTGVTTFKDLFYAGVAVYFYGYQYLWIYCIFSMFVFQILSFLRLSLSTDQRIFIAAWLSFVLLNCIALFTLEPNEKIISFDRIVPTLMVCMMVILFKKQEYPQHYLLIALIGIAWGTSISWGGTSPLMYFTPIVFASYYLLQSRLNIFNRGIQIFVLLSMGMYSALVNSHPYRDSFIWQPHQDATGLSDKLAFIRINPIIKAKHLELSQVLTRYPASSILPSMPGAHYLNEIQNPLPIDWPMDAEIAYQSAEVIEAVVKCCEYAIVEKKAIGQPVGTDGKFHSSVTAYVQKNYILHDSSFEYFDIYQRPLAAAKM